MDGAGCHRNDKLVEFLKQEFEKRGWYYRPQPAQSPTTNVCDLTIFPCMSKRVSKNHRQWKDGSIHAMKPQEIWDAVMEEFRKLQLTVIANAFMTCKRLVTDLIEAEGSNTYLKEKNACHKDVRKTFIKSESGLINKKRAHLHHNSVGQRTSLAPLLVRNTNTNTSSSSTSSSNIDNRVAEVAVASATPEVADANWELVPQCAYKCRYCHVQNNNPLWLQQHGSHHKESCIRYGRERRSDCARKHTNRLIED